MVRLTLSTTCLSLALFLVQESATKAFSVARKSAEGTSLSSFSAFNYDEKDSIMMEQKGGVVPSKPRKPIKTVPSAISKIKIEKVSDDQHDFNFHDVPTVPSAMSKIQRGRSASDDQHDANFQSIRTVPSSMSKIDHGSSASNDSNIKTIQALPGSLPSGNNSKYRRVPSSTSNYNKQS